MGLQRHDAARSDARWLIQSAGQPDAPPATDDIEKAIRHAVSYGSLGELAYALEHLAISSGHAGGSAAARCVVDLLAEWIRDTDTGGRAA